MHLSFVRRVEDFAKPMEPNMSKREMIDTGKDKRYVRRVDKASSRKASMCPDRVRKMRGMMPRKMPSRGKATRATGSAGRTAREARDPLCERHRWPARPPAMADVSGRDVVCLQEPKGPDANSRCAR